MLAHSGLAAIAALALAPVAQAALPVYGNSGSENPVSYGFTAAADGDVVATYANFGGAAFTNYLGLEVNGVDTGFLALNNQTSSPGDTFNFGPVSAGDALTFYIQVNPSAGYTTLPAQLYWYSDTSRNLDGANHVFSAAYAGGVENGVALPAGTFVAFEDLPAPGVFDGIGADYNYGDLAFIFGNVSAQSAAVPEPATWAMMLAGFGLVGGTMRRRQKVAVGYAA